MISTSIIAAIITALEACHYKSYGKNYFPLFHKFHLSALTVTSEKENNSDILNILILEK